MFKLTKRLAVITGGSGSLGLGIAQTLQAQGAHVVILGRSQQSLDIALSKLDKFSTRAVAYSCDVTNELQLCQIRDQIIVEYKKIDILVTCAAAPAMNGKFEETEFDAWRSMMGTDLDGVFLACKIFGSSMIAQKFGRIVNITSFHNVATYPYRTIYNAAKSGVDGLSRALAVEWGHLGITVNTIAPGPILTPRTNWFISQSSESEIGMLSRTPSGRLGDVADLSSAVAFLVSDEAKHINGQQIVLDGGWTKNAWWGDHTRLS